MCQSLLQPGQLLQLHMHGLSFTLKIIMSWVSSVYEYSVYAWPYLNHCPQFTPLYCLMSVTVQTTRKLPCAFQLQSISLQVVDAALWL